MLSLARTPSLPLAGDGRPSCVSVQRAYGVILDTRASWGCLGAIPAASQHRRGIRFRVGRRRTAPGKRSFRVLGAAPHSLVA